MFFEEWEKGFVKLKRLLSCFHRVRHSNKLLIWHCPWVLVQTCQYWPCPSWYPGTWPSLLSPWSHTGPAPGRILCCRPGTVALPPWVGGSPGTGAGSGAWQPPVGQYSSVSSKYLQLFPSALAWAETCSAPIVSASWIRSQERGFLLIEYPAEVRNLPLRCFSPQDTCHGET